MGILCAKRKEIQGFREVHTSFNVHFPYFFVVFQRKELDYTCANLVARENMRVIKTVAEVPDRQTLNSTESTHRGAPLPFRTSMCIPSLYTYLSTLQMYLHIFQFSPGQDILNPLALEIRVHGMFMHVAGCWPCAHTNLIYTHTRLYKFKYKLAHFLYFFWAPPHTSWQYAMMGGAKKYAINF